jgi:hypothetical protein
MVDNLTITETRCYAWSLMPNHVHLVLATGNKPIRTVLQCLFTGYALSINRKYGRSGHLFQGRYKSILCEEEVYLLALVRYVHLNPVKSGIVASLPLLAKYRWSGHRALLGLCESTWQESADVLSRFGVQKGKARDAYVAFLSEGLEHPGNEDDINGRGMKRIREGGWERGDGKAFPDDTYADERIAGSRMFVEKVLKDAGERERWRSKMAAKGWDAARVIRRAESMFGIKPGDLKGNGKKPSLCMARSMACKWLVDDLGKSEIEVSNLLGLSQPGVSMCVRRGRMMEKAKGCRFEK